MSKIAVQTFFIILVICQTYSYASDIDGIWRGPVQQINPSKIFDTTIIIDSENLIYKIDYGLNGDPYYCGGHWLPAPGPIFQEISRYGSCINGFVQFTTLENGTATFHWWNDGPVQATGRFTRVTSLTH